MVTKPASTLSKQDNWQCYHLSRHPGWTEVRLYSMKKTDSVISLILTYKSLPISDDNKKACNMKENSNKRCQTLQYLDAVLNNFFYRDSLDSHNIY